LPGLGAEHLIKGKTIKEIARRPAGVAETRCGSAEVGRDLIRVRELGTGRVRSWGTRASRSRRVAGGDIRAKSAPCALTLIRIFESCAGRGYDGELRAVRRYARRLSKEAGQSTAAAYVTLELCAGRSLQLTGARGGSAEWVTVIVNGAHRHQASRSHQPRAV